MNVLRYNVCICISSDAGFGPNESRMDVRSFRSINCKINLFASPHKVDGKIDQIDTWFFMPKINS